MIAATETLGTIPVSADDRGVESTEDARHDRPGFEDRIGSVVGGYVLEEVVGSGGMGVVYRARHGETGRIVALKLMLPEVASNRRFRERFILEAQVAPELDHPNIVPVFEVGESRAQLFIAMRLVDGPDLKDIIEREGALEISRALRIFRQASGALDHAHERGMVHRDVKPQNFLVTTAEDGGDHVYLTDFGLVKPTSAESTASRTTDVFGSIQYMSPEQIEALPVDGRADVYSLACVAFECLTGKAPFERPNEISLLWAHVHEEPPRVTDVRSSLPGGLDLPLRQAMSKHPDDRFLTCGEFVGALEEGGKQQRRPLVAPIMRPLVKRIPRPKTEREVWAPNYFPELSRVRKLTERTNWVQVAAVIAILCLLAATLVQFGREGGIPQAAADVLDAVQDVGGDLAGALSRDGRPSPDDGSEPAGDFGREVGRGRAALPDAQGPSADENQQLGEQPSFARQPGRDNPAPAAGTLPIAPRTPKIVWVSARQLYGDVSDLWVMRADGSGKTRLTATVADENWPDWSPDGMQIAYIRDGDLWIMDSDGSDARGFGLCSLQRPCSEPDWSPDGNRILFTRATENIDTGQTSSIAAVFVLNLTSDSVRRVPGLTATSKTSDGSIQNAVWSPSGRRIAGTCRAAEQKSEGFCVVKPNGQAVERWEHDAISLAWSPRGATIAGEACGGGLQGSVCLTRWGREGFKDVPGPDEYDPSWSADGGELVFSRLDRALHGDLFRMDLSGSAPVRLTDWPDTTDIQPDWWGPAS